MLILISLSLLMLLNGCNMQSSSFPDFSNPMRFERMGERRPIFRSRSNAPIMIMTTPAPPQSPPARASMTRAVARHHEAPVNVFRRSLEPAKNQSSSPASRQLFGGPSPFGGGPFNGNGFQFGGAGPSSPMFADSVGGGGGGSFLGPTTGALIGGGGGPIGPFNGGGGASPMTLQQLQSFRFNNFMSQMGPFQQAHSEEENHNEGQTFNPMFGFGGFNTGNGQMSHFDNTASLFGGGGGGGGGGFGGFRGFGGFGGGGAPFGGSSPFQSPGGFNAGPSTESDNEANHAGAEFTGASPAFVGGGGGQRFNQGFLGPFGRPLLPPNCECRQIADCRDVSVLARQLPIAGPRGARGACPPGLVVCCNEPRTGASVIGAGGGPPPPLPPPSSSPFIVNPPSKILLPPPGPPPGPPPPAALAGGGGGGPPPPLYTVKNEGCGLKGSNPLARVLDIGVPDAKFADAEFGEFPWMAAVLRADRTYACGGALVKPRAVVTAAHCVSKLKFEDIIVRLGEYDVESTQELPYQDVVVTDVVIHAGYHSGTLANDIAVLILAEPARLSSYIRPVCLPPFHDYLSFKCQVTGWGKNLPNGLFSRVLKKVDVPIVDQGFCENEYRKSPELGPLFNLDQSFVCAGSPGKDACYGDGGAPLVCEYQGFWRLVGLVSWGIGCGQYPGVYIDITKFVPWMYDVFAKYTFLA